MYSLPIYLPLNQILNILLEREKKFIEIGCINDANDCRTKYNKLLSNIKGYPKVGENMTLYDCYILGMDVM